MSLSAHRVRRSVACAAGITACLLGVSACGTGFGAQTSQPYQAAAGTNERADGVDLLNVVAVENTDGTATVSAGMINKSGEEDALNAVSGTDSDGNEIDVQYAGPVPLEQGKLETLGEEAEIVISDDALSAGYYATLSFEFDNVAPVEVDVPVVSRGEDATYEDIAEAPEPEPEPTDKGDEKKPSGDQR